jgi:DNA modification methylase
MVWLQTDPTPLCGGNYLIDKEFCLYIWKGVHLNTKFETAFTYWISNKNTADRNLFDHPNCKPVEIVKTLISNSSNEGDIVADFFLGSGTTCIAAKELNRQYIGFEIDEKYYNIALDRLNGMTQIDRKIKDTGQLSIDDFLKKVSN